MELVQSYGVVLYDRASAAGLSFLVFPYPDIGDMRNLGVQPVCEADPLSLQHALIPMLAGLDATTVAGVVTAAKDDAQSIPQMLDSFRRRFGDWLVEMAEHATTAPIIPLQETPSGFQSLATFGSQLRVDAGAVIGEPATRSGTAVLVVFGQKATVLIRSTTPGTGDYINHNLLDEFFRRTVMDVRVLMTGEMPSIDR